MDATVAKASPGEVWAWALYDWANSAYSTLSITVLVFYMQAVLPDGLGALAWGWGIGLTELVAAVSSPILGAVADARGNKRFWLGATALTGSTAASLMFFATPERGWLLVALFLVAHLAFELSQVVYNGFLPEIADDENMGRISAKGYALGYLGGGLALAGFLALHSQGWRLGLPTSADDPTALLPRLGLGLMGLWWGLFTLPALFWLRDRRSAGADKNAADVPLGQAVKRAVAEVGSTLRNIRRYRMLALFLIGFLFYNDGVQTVISQASVFAKSSLDMGASDLVLVVLTIQFIALPGAWAVGRLADKIGHKPTLVSCLAVWIGLVGASYFVTEKSQFWVLSVILALVLGGVQSVSRAVMGLMTPKDRAAEFFGFFNLSGKATSIFGPILFAQVLYSTRSPHWAILSLLVFFLIGLALVLRVNVREGQLQARS